MLMAAARDVWPFIGDEYQPHEMGVVDGVVWATTRGDVGFNGYALIPAEGHPWSRAWPNNIEDQAEAVVRQRKMLTEFGRNLQTRGEAEAVRQVGEWVDLDADYLDNYLDVRGGVTYYVHPWVGFDCAHSWDVWEEQYDWQALCVRYRKRCALFGDSAEPCDGHRHWFPSMVAEGAKRMAQQIADYGHIDRIQRETNRMIEEE